MEEEKKDKPEEGQGEEGAAEGQETLEPPKKTLSKKMIIIIAVAAVLLLGGIGAGLYFMGVFGGSEPVAEGHAALDQATPEGQGGEGAAKQGEADRPPVFFSLGDILVNLNGDGKRPNFLKIKVVLELTDEKDTAPMETLKPRIVDHFQTYLRELRIEDLRGSAGLYRLREELLLRVTEAVQPIRVRDVLFQEMLVQ